MRYRETVTGGFNVVNDWKNYESDGTTVQSHAYSYSGGQTTKSIEDVSVPSFKKLLACGEFLPLNPVTIRKEVVDLVAGSGSFFDHNGVRRQDGDFALSQTFYIPPPELDQSLVDAVILSAMSNAASEKWDVLTFLAEFNKSVDTIRSAANGFLSISQKLANLASRRYWAGLAYKSKYRTQTKSPWEIFQDLWLGARYSVRPMVYDALDATRALQHLMKGDATYVKGRGFQNSAINETFDTGWTVRTAKTEEKYVETLTGSLTYRGVSFISLESGLHGAIQANPLVTAWELTPWSFVFDWFVNIGGYINTLTPFLMGDFAGTMYSTKVELTWLGYYNVRPRAVSQPYTGGAGPASKRKVLTEYIRTEHSGAPPPPPFNPRLNLPKVVDLVALLVRGKGNIHKTLSSRR